MLQIGTHFVPTAWFHHPIGVISSSVVSANYKHYLIVDECYLPSLFFNTRIKNDFKCYYIDTVCVQGLVLL